MQVIVRPPDVRPMGVREAQQKTEEVRDHLRVVAAKADKIRHLLVDIKYREGWRAMGYANWSRYIAEEFEWNERTIQRQLAAAMVESEILPNRPTVGSQPIPESKIRHLAELPEGQRREAWEEATRNGRDPTMEDVRKIVRDRQGRLEDMTAQEQLETIKAAEQDLKHESRMLDAEDRMGKLIQAKQQTLVSLKHVRKGWEAARKANKKLKNAYAIRGRRAIEQLTKAMKELELLIEDK